MFVVQTVQNNPHNVQVKYIKAVVFNQGAGAH